MTEQQQEESALFALGLLDESEQQQFSEAVRASGELRDFLRSLQRMLDRLALAVPQVAPPTSLKQRVLSRISAAPFSSSNLAFQAGTGFALHRAADQTGWKQLPVAGAWIKLLSLQRERGYAVLMGRLGAGVRYPAHTHAGSEDLLILTGDLHIGDLKLQAGDFHHSDPGTRHEANYSVQGCTLLAVVPANHELVQFAMAGE